MTLDQILFHLEEFTKVTSLKKTEHYKTSYIMDNLQGKSFCEVYKVQEYGAIVLMDYELKKDSIVSVSYDGFIFIGYYHQISETKKKVSKRETFLLTLFIPVLIKRKEPFPPKKALELRGFLWLFFPHTMRFILRNVFLLKI